ncbi:hypothetical protein [Nostoc commune]|nr:hypothetical protein [Nostoc commune]
MFWSVGHGGIGVNCKSHLMRSPPPLWRSPDYDFYEKYFEYFN